MAQPKDPTFKGTYATREKYLAYIEKQKERYANDEEFCERMKEYQRRHRKMIMESPILHARHNFNRRGYQREYARKRKLRLEKQKLINERIELLVNARLWKRQQTGMQSSSRSRLTRTTS